MAMVLENITHLKDKLNLKLIFNGTNMNELVISTQTLNQVLAYLGSRPYQEVFQLIEAIQNEAKNQPVKEEQVETHE